MLSLRAALGPVCLAVSLCSPRSAAAQEPIVDQTGVAAPSTDGGVEPAPVPAPPATAPPVALITASDPWAEYIRTQEIVRLRVQGDVLRESNRRLLAPGVVLGVGVTSIIVGGIVFARAWSASEDYSVSRDRAGLVMIPVGVTLTLIGAPLLAVRVSRVLRLRRIDRALRALGNR